MGIEVRLLDVAREYCQLIETADDAGPDWLERLSGLLPQLHAGLTELRGYTDRAAANDCDDDLDARFSCFSRLHRLLGDRDPYWLEFDSGDDGPGMTGSLADDLTDIYWELKNGLALMEDEDDTDSAFGGWELGFRMHWGQHLLDAERHLYELSARNQLRH